MVDGAELTFDAEQFDSFGKRVVAEITGAGAKAVSSATKELERALEAATRGAVPGRLWRAWGSTFYPNETADAAGIVFARGGARTRGAVTFWSRPGAVRSKSGGWLAIPLPAAGSTGRGRLLTPVEWEARHNQELRFVPRSGRAALLVADDAVLSGRGQIARPNTARRIAAGRRSATVPIFVLLKTVRFRNTLSIEPLVAGAERALVQDFLAASG